MSTNEIKATKDAKCAGCAHRRKHHDGRTVCGGWTIGNGGPCNCKTFSESKADA